MIWKDQIFQSNQRSNREFQSMAWECKFFQSKWQGNKWKSSLEERLKRKSLCRVNRLFPSLFPSLFPGWEKRKNNQYTCKNICWGKRKNEKQVQTTQNRARERERKMSEARWWNSLFPPKFIFGFRFTALTVIFLVFQSYCKMISLS